MTYNYSWNNKKDSSGYNYSWNNNSNKEAPIYNIPLKKTTTGKIIRGIGNFAKLAAQDVAGSLVVQPGARATEAVTRTLFPNSLAAKGYQALSDQNQSQNFKLPLIGNVPVAPQKAFGQGGGKQIVGNILHKGAYLAPFVAGKTILGTKIPKIKPIISSGAKLTPKTINTARIVNRALVGATELGSFGAGSALQANKNYSDVAKETLINAGIGAGLNIAGPVLGKLIKGKPKIDIPIKDNPQPLTNDINIPTEAPIILDRSILTVIDKAKNGGGETLNIDGSIKQPKKDFIVSIRSKNFNKDTITKEDFKNFINQNQDLINEYGDKIKIGTFDLGKDNLISVDINLALKNKNQAIKLAKLGRQQSVFDEEIAKLTNYSDNSFIKTGFDGLNPKTLSIKDINSVISNNTLSKASINPIDSIKQQKVETTKKPSIKIDNNVSNKALEDIKIENNFNRKLGKVDSINHIEENKKAQDFINSVSEDEAFKVGMNLENPPKGVRASAVHSNLINYYEKIGNNKKLIELTNSDVKKFSAQDVGLARIINPGSSYFTIKDIQNSLDNMNKNNLFNKLGGKDIKEKIFKQFKTTLEKTKLTVNEISLLAENLIC